MSDTLAAVFAPLVRHHIATTHAPFPEPGPGITWIWAANGIFKRGRNDSLDLLIPVSRTCQVPGLRAFAPRVRWHHPSLDRLPGTLLTDMLALALEATTSLAGVLTPAELQAFVVWGSASPELLVPPQRGRFTTVSYQQPDEAVILLDLHSHHAMPAYFSAQDEQDDRSAGLSISAVLGTIFTTPDILVRLNVYGHHCIVPALTVFDSLGPCVDAAGRTHVKEHAQCKP
jgi:PRTRC genetic system protein A